MKVIPLIEEWVIFAQDTVVVGAATLLVGLGKFHVVQHCVEAECPPVVVFAEYHVAVKEVL